MTAPDAAGGAPGTAGVSPAHPLPTLPRKRGRVGRGLRDARGPRGRPPSLPSPTSGGGWGGGSKRKLRANRLGKPAGTGPTSAAGKARSAQNARKHGLNVEVMYDPNVSADVAFMAEEIAPGCQDPELIGRARQIAEAQVDLMRVARARRDIISAAMAVSGISDQGSVIRHQCPPVAILSDIGARLARLDRYERGALWRRKCAVRAFDTARRKAARRRRPPKV